VLVVVTAVSVLAALLSVEAVVSSDLSFPLQAIRETEIRIASIARLLRF